MFEENVVCLGTREYGRSYVQALNEITRLKQQLKDKDEKISKAEEYLEKYVNKELEYLYKKNDDFHKGKDFGDGSYGCAIQAVQAIRENILEILKINKEE